MGAKDIMEKTLEGYNDVFADIMNVLLFRGERIVRDEELSDALPRSYYKASGEVREQERDVAKYWHNHQIRIAMLGIENQTEEDAEMPLRVIGYDGAAYRDQIKKGEKTRYPVITLVLYFNHKKRWSKPLHLLDCFEVPEGLRPYVNDYKVHLVEVAWLTREQVEMFQSDFKIVADYFVQKRENEAYVAPRETIRHAQEVWQLMSALSGDNRYEEIGLGERSAENMCEVLDRAEKRGEERGEKRGIIKGATATLLRLGMEQEQILTEIIQQFQLDEATAREYLEEMLGERKAAIEKICVK